MSEQHTLGPWEVGPGGGIYPVGKGRIIASLQTQNGGRRDNKKANAVFILLACNSHYNLIAERDRLNALCGELVKMLGKTRQSFQNIADAFNVDRDPKIRAALSQIDTLLTKAQKELT